MAEPLNHFKKDYRTRFCHGGGNKIHVQPGQNVLKLIQDCFESCSSDLTINSPNCSTFISKNESQMPKTGSAKSVKGACESAEPSPASPLKPVRSRGQSCESHLKPATHDYVAASRKTESPVSKNEKKDTLKDVEALCQHPAVLLDSEDNHGSVGSPFPVEEAKSSPVVNRRLRSDDWNTPAAAKSHGEVEHLEGPQPGKDEQVVPVQGTERVTASSARRETVFSSAVLAAVSTRTLGQRYSTLIPPPSPRPVKRQDTEIENECEFLIDESSDASSSSWISIPTKSKKPKSNGSATPISKSQPSEKQKTQNKKVKNRKVQVEALTKQKLDHLDLGAFDLKEMSESDPVSNDKENVLTSQNQKSIHMEKTKKDALIQDSPNQKKNTSWKPEAEELMLSLSGLEAKPSDEDQCQTRMLPSEDLPLPSSGHQEEQIMSLKESLKSSKNLNLTSKPSQHLVKKKQTAKQKLLAKVAKRGTVSPSKKLQKSVQKSSNKKPQLQREESSDSEPGEELEREPVELNEVCTTPLHQKLETPVIHKLKKSEKHRNVLHTPESPGGANNKTLKTPQRPMDSVRNPEKKQLSAKYSWKIPKKIPRRTNKALCSSPEDTEPQTDSDSSSAQDMARKKQKLSDAKIKSNKRKHGMQHEPQDSFVAEKVVSYESGPVIEDCDKFSSSAKSPEQDDTSSDNSEDLNYKLRQLLSDDIARQKIVMPSNTPNVRRTKRIRLKPLEYWRGERINYTMKPSGGLVISGLVCPETQPPWKSKRRKDRPKQKSNKTNRREIPASLDHSLADTSKPTIVLDPVTNEEVHLDCINTANSHIYYVKDESVEIYKNLNTSLFATGKLVLKPFKEKGHQFVHMDTIAFHIIHGKVIVTLHKTSYYLTAGDCFYVPAGNGYNIRNLLNEDSVLLFTQLKNRTKAGDVLLDTSSPLPAN